MFYTQNNQEQTMSTNIELLVSGKTFPMTVKSFSVDVGGERIDMNAPELSRAESAALDAHVAQVVSFYDMFSDAVTYCYIEGQMTSGTFGDEDNEVEYQILLNGAPVDYATLHAALN
jgi:hypothetical protein